VNVVRTDVGKHTMDEISRIVGDMRLAETRELSAATAQWQADFQVSRWVSAAGVILNIGLVLLATHLVYGDMRRRARQAINLRDQKQELEREVDERTRELTALSTHLQGVSEQEKSALSRELHDELGGLLVAARMDLSWLQQRLPTSDPAIEQRFKRIHESLSSGVDLKRRVVEELRPTLLDNMGLFTALRWQFKETCRRAGLKCTETIPDPAESASDHHIPRPRVDAPPNYRPRRQLGGAQPDRRRNHRDCGHSIAENAADRDRVIRGAVTDSSVSRF
jgi:signal transduction histidine kinase